MYFRLPQDDYFIQTMNFGPNLSKFEKHLRCYLLFYIFWLLFETQQKVICQELIYSTQFTSIDDWMIFKNSIELSSYQIQGCWDKNIFGETGDIIIFKTFFIPPHYAIEIQFNLYFSQQYDVHYIIQVDDELLEFWQQYNSQIQCGNNLMISEYYFSNYKLHNSKTLQIQIISEQIDQPYYWGISDVKLFISQCPFQCYSCDNSGSCEQLIYNSVIFGEKIIQVAEGWLKNDQSFNGIKSCGRFQIFGLFSNNDVIKAQFTLPRIHQKVRIRFKLISLETLYYELKLQVQGQEKQFYLPTHTLSIIYKLMCGDEETISIIDTQFENDAENLQIQMQVINSESSGDIFGIRDFEILSDEKILEKEQEDLSICSFERCCNLLDGCSSCVKGQCLECQTNWVYDSQNNNCIPLCGDRVIVGLEECDDSNEIQNDGCFQCQFSCPLNCQLCQFGQCLICYTSFQLINNSCIQDDANKQYLNDYLPYISKCQIECIVCQERLCIKCLKGWNLINFECVQECGDGILAEMKEQCDDGNYEQDDGCYNCKFEYSNTSVLSVCGDGIIQDLEQCDDQNAIPYDGCFECQFQCQQNCINCVDGICLILQPEDQEMQNCDFGLYLIDNKCLSICGDLLVAADEKCEDENNQPFDGCFQCQYSCSLNCQNCEDGQCITCDIGYYVDNNVCKEKCGDGLQTINEQCDDGNTSSLDGCSENCTIEIFWNCITNSELKSQCFQGDNPILQLQYLNTTFNKQFVLMNSNQQIRLKEVQQNLTQALLISIQNLNNMSYIVTIQNIIEPTFEEYKNINYLFIVELLEQLEIELIFQVSYNISLVNNYDLEVSNKELKLKLKNPIVLSEEQKKASIKASQFSTIMLIILGASSFIIFLSGNPTNCFEVLDALQQQSYLRFINVAFPENVFIYFESSEFLSVQPFLTKFNLVDLFQIILGQELLESFQKFYFYSINADLFTNFQTQIFQITVYLLLAFIYFFYVKIQIKKCFTSRQLINIWLQKSLILEKVVAFIYQINKIILSFGPIFSINGLILWLLANSWDILFKILLYLYSKPQNSLRTQFSCSLSLLIMIFLILLSTSYLLMKKQNHKLNKLKFFRHQGLIIIKKFLFLLILVQGQENSLIQCLLIGLVTTFYLGFIIIAKLLDDKIDIIIIFWFELPIVLFTISSIFHHDDFIKHISNNQQILIGFLQIGILCFGLLSPLLKYACILIKKGKNYIIERQKQILAEKKKKKQLGQLFI